MVESRGVGGGLLDGPCIVRVLMKSEAFAVDNASCYNTRPSCCPRLAGRMTRQRDKIRSSMHIRVRRGHTVCYLNTPASFYVAQIRISVDVARHNR